MITASSDVGILYMKECCLILTQIGSGFANFQQKVSQPSFLNAIYLILNNFAKVHV